MHASKAEGWRPFNHLDVFFVFVFVFVVVVVVEGW